MDKECLLELRNVGKSYNHPSGENILAIEDISLKIHSGSFFMIYGPSGSGKSTLLKIAGLIETPSQGTMLFKGNPIENSSKKRSELIKNNVGFILQRSNLLNYLNALENVLLPMENYSKKEALELLEYMGVKNPEECPKKLSPFNQQKVALARALINKPSIILADEPTGDLNKKDSKEFIKLLKSFNKETTIILCTNDPELLKYADDGIKMRNGKIEMRI